MMVDNTQLTELINKDARLNFEFRGCYARDTFPTLQGRNANWQTIAKQMKRFWKNLKLIKKTSGYKLEQFRPLLGQLHHILTGTISFYFSSVTSSERVVSSKMYSRSQLHNSSIVWASTKKITDISTNELLQQIDSALQFKTSGTVFQQKFRRKYFTPTYISLFCCI